MFFIHEILSCLYFISYQTYLVFRIERKIVKNQFDLLIDLDNKVDLQLDLINQILFWDLDHYAGLIKNVYIIGTSTTLIQLQYQNIKQQEFMKYEFLKNVRLFLIGIYPN